MSESTAARGRPRSQASRDAILAATMRLVDAGGYVALSIEAVATEARVGKTTIYRWWRSKAELAVDAFFTRTRADITLGSTESAPADFREQIRQLSKLLSGARGRAFAAMIGGALYDKQLAKALRERWLNPRRAWGYQRMVKAAEDGQLRKGVDIGAALAVLYSPLYTPLLFGEPTPSGAALDAVLDIALRAIFETQ